MRPVSSSGQEEIGGEQRDCGEGVVGLYRKVSTAYWKGELAEQLRGDALAHAVAFYLMTNPATNAIGCYRLSIATLCAAASIAGTTVRTRWCGRGLSSGRLAEVVAVTPRDRGRLSLAIDPHSAGVSRPPLFHVKPFRTVGLPPRFRP